MPNEVQSSNERREMNPGKMVIYGRPVGAAFSREQTPPKKDLDFAPPLWFKYMHYKRWQKKRRG